MPDRTRCVMTSAVILWVAAVSCSFMPFPAAAEEPPRVRIDAYGWVRWTRASVDPSGGVQKYRVRVNVATGAQTSGGFEIKGLPWMTGTINKLDVDTKSIPKPPSTKPARASGAIRAKAHGTCVDGGKKYRLVFALVGDDAQPGSAPGARNRLVPGRIEVQLIGPLGAKQPPVQIAQSVEGTRVRAEVYWPSRGGGMTGGATVAEGLEPRPGSRR